MQKIKSEPIKQKVDNFEILISEKDQAIIDRRRQKEEEAERKKAEELERNYAAYQSTKETPVSELQQNYDEYNQYMEMIGKMLGIEDEAQPQDDKPALQNYHTEPVRVQEEEEEQKANFKMSLADI